MALLRLHGCADDFAPFAVRIQKNSVSYSVILSANASLSKDQEISL